MTALLAPPGAHLVHRSTAAGAWVARAETFAADLDGVIVTVEPSASQKATLAVPGGEPPDRLHVTLCSLGSVTTLGEDARRAIGTVMASFGASTGPIPGTISGLGWFGSPDDITIALVDAEGLSAFRVALVDALTAAGYPPVDNGHDFTPHITMGYGPVDASAAVGAMLAFDELRVRWGTEVLAFDLLGQPGVPAPPPPMVEEAPVAEPMGPELAPIPPDSPPPGFAERMGDVADKFGWNEDHEAAAAADRKAGPMTTTTTKPARRGRNAGAVSRRAFADEVPAAAPPSKEPPADIGTLGDDALALEMARRLAEQTVASIEAEGGSVPDSARAALETSALSELTEALSEVVEDLAEDMAEGEPPPEAVAEAAQRVRARLRARAAQLAEMPGGVIELVVCPECGQEVAPTGEGLCPNCGAFCMEEGRERMAAESARPFDWEGVLTVEGVMSGDSRMIGDGALTWRTLPVPLMLQTVNAPGHDGAAICGSIVEVERQGHTIVGRGYFSSNEAGQMARALLSEGTLRGVSVDIDSVQMVFADPSGAELSPDEAMEAQMFGGGPEVVEMIVSGRVMGATLTPFPAFQEAFVYLLDETADAHETLVASAAGPIWRASRAADIAPAGQHRLAALVASAAGPDPDAPPAEWFQLLPMDEPQPFEVHADGRCYGLVAQWGTCHIGDSTRCTPVPRNNDFRTFYTGKKVQTAEGTMLSVGPIIMDTVHPNLLAQASDAQAFYAHTGCAVADVRLYTNEHGIVAAGALRPDVDPSQVRRLRASDISPDWRPINGELRLVSLLAVNTSGFLVEGIAASAGRFQPWGRLDLRTGQVAALVAAGAVRRERRSVGEEIDDLRAELADMRAAHQRMLTTVASMVGEGAKDRSARMSAALGTLGLDCGCDPEPDPEREARLSAALSVFGTSTFAKKAGDGGKADKVLFDALTAAAEMVRSASPGEVGDGATEDLTGDTASVNSMAAAAETLMSASQGGTGAEVNEMQAAGQAINDALSVRSAAAIENLAADGVAVEALPVGPEVLDAPLPDLVGQTVDAGGTPIQMTDAAFALWGASAVTPTEVEVEEATAEGAPFPG